MKSIRDAEKKARSSALLLCLCSGFILLGIYSAMVYVTFHCFEKMEGIKIEKAKLAEELKRCTCKE